MKILKFENHVSLIDAETAGMRDFIASYVLKGEKAAIIETGPTSSVDNLVLGLKKLNIGTEEVAYIAVSHIHLDHAGGAGTLARHLPNAKVVVHPKGAFHLANPEKLWKQSQQVLGAITELYGEPEPVPENRIIQTSDGMVLELGRGIELQVVETVGHASHHQSFYDRSSRGIFPGDTAGIYLNSVDAIVPTTPPPLRLDLVLAAIDKLLRLNSESLFYSHFGRASGSNERLRFHADQLKMWAREAKQGLDRKENLGEIGKRIFDADSSLRRAWNSVRTHPVLSETVLGNSVQGVVEYVRDFGVPR